MYAAKAIRLEAWSKRCSPFAITVNIIIDIRTHCSMAFLSDSCTFHELTDDILAACQPFSCGNEDLDDFFAHDATRYAHFLMGKTYCFRSGSDPSKNDATMPAKTS